MIDGMLRWGLCIALGFWIYNKIIGTEIIDWPPSLCMAISCVAAEEMLYGGRPTSRVQYRQLQHFGHCYLNLGGRMHRFCFLESRSQPEPRMADGEKASLIGNLGKPFPGACMRITASLRQRIIT